MNAFEKVIGYEKEKDELMQLCDIVKNSQKYRNLGVALPTGILLHGVPGVGKTLMATALVEEMGRKSFICRKDKSNSAFVDSIRDTFVAAKENAPSVVFLDDLDKFASDEDVCNPEELIAVQSGIDAVKGFEVFIVATANDISDLPRSLLRAGRFDRIIEIGTPNLQEAAKIIRHYLKDKKVADDVNPESVARMLEGNSCAVLESVLNDAGIYAGYRNEVKIHKEDIVRAVLRNVFQADEWINDTSIEMKEEAAFHEAGHATVALSFAPEGVGLISVRPCKSDVRGIIQLFQDKNYFGSYERMKERVIAILAGKAAVEIKFGRLDVGASSDIDRASAIVERFIKSYAISGFDLFYPRSRSSLVSENQNDRIVAERSSMLTRFYERAKEILVKNWDFVEKLAAALVEKDTLEFEEVSTLYKNFVA